MENKLLEALAKSVVYTCMVLAAAALIFMFTGFVVVAFNWMVGVMW